MYRFLLRSNTPLKLCQCNYSNKIPPRLLKVHVTQGPNKLWVPGHDDSFINSKSVSSILNREKLIETFKELPRRCISALLPHEYPHSVKPGYGRYVTGQMLGSMSSSAAGILSFQALLHAVGLGSGAIPMAAALNWIIKDGLGQLGGVIFAATVNTKFDSDPKKWRLLSSVALDSSCFLELMTPAAPMLFIPLAAAANVGKNISWLSASASRAAIHNSFVNHANLADLTAKTGTQSMCASLLGTTLGIGVSSVVGSEWGFPLVMSFAALSSTHLAATVWSLQAVTLNTVNPKRASMIVEDYLSSCTIPLPHEVGSRESIIQLHPTPDWLLYGAPLNCAVGNSKELESLLINHQDYLLSVRKRGDEVAIVLLLLEQCASRDLIQGLVHANIVKDMIVNKQSEFSTGKVRLLTKRHGVLRSLSGDGWDLCKEVVEGSREESRMKASDILKGMESSGWDVEVCHLDTEPIHIEKGKM